MTQMNWLEVAKNLQVGQSTRHDCPECGVGTNTNAAIINNNTKYYSVYCHACGPIGYEKKGVLTLQERKHIQDRDDEARKHSRQRTICLPKDTTFEPAQFSREARAWLFKGGLTPTIWRKYNIGYSESIRRVVLPIYDDNGNLTWYQLRAILKEQRPKYIQPSADKSGVVFTAGVKTTSSRTVIVEDIMSAIRVGEAGRRVPESRNFYATSLLGTKISQKQASIVSKSNRVTIWLDNDRAGREGAKSIKRSLSLLCEVDQVRTEQDPKYYSNNQIRKVLQ